jgi:hypothetical protein
VREIICHDAIPWLRHNHDVGAVITSLPDAEEMGLPFDQWEEWFIHAAHLCMNAASLDQPCIFYQTDRKVAGRLSSKASLLMRAADKKVKMNLLWHKIVMRRSPGGVDLFRPGFSHLLAFSSEATSGSATPDVLQKAASVYQNGFPINAARIAVEFAIASRAQVIVDPFCGRGTVPALAEMLKIKSIGIDIDPAQCESAKRLRFKDS